MAADMVDLSTSDKLKDMDRFAPQVSVGLLSRCERNELQNSCNRLTKPEENSYDAYEKCETVELLEGCESVDIAGTSEMEVENARLKAELASAIALICMFNAEIGYDSLDEGKLDILVKTVKEKTVEALHLREGYVKHIQSMRDMKRMQCLSYEKRIQELEQRFSDQYMLYIY